MPSSPHLNARDRACSYGKSGNESQPISGVADRECSYGSRHLHHGCSPLSLRAVWLAICLAEVQAELDGQLVTGGPLSLRTWVPVFFQYFVRSRSSLRRFSSSVRYSWPSKTTMVEEAGELPAAASSSSIRQGLEAKGGEGEEGIIWVAQGLQRSSE